MATSTASFEGLFHPHGRKNKILQNRQVRKQVKRLKHHANVTTNSLNRPDIVGQLRPVHYNGPGLVFLQAVDTGS